MEDVLRNMQGCYDQLSLDLSQATVAPEGIDRPKRGVTPRMHTVMCFVIRSGSSVVACIFMQDKT